VGFTGEVAAGGGGSREEAVGPLLDVLSRFRERVRGAAKDFASLTAGDLLKLCDELRNGELPELGVRLEDGGGWKLSSKEDLAREAATAAEKAAKKAEAAAEAKRKEEEKRKRAAVPPQRLFVDGPDATLYSRYDGDGVPTHNAAGEELQKSALKNLRKLWEKQKELHEKFQGGGGGGGDAAGEPPP
jgi:cysteinyl-tRNA synthetase